MRVRSLSAALLIIAPYVFAQPVFVPTLDEMSFGSCHVFTTMDDFTDELSHFAICEAHGGDAGYLHRPRAPWWNLTALQEDPVRFDYLAIVACTPLGPGAAFQAGATWTDEATAKVRYRFDRGDVFSATWNWNREFYVAFAGDSSPSRTAIVAPILRGIATADRFVFEVEGDKGVVDLTTADGRGVVEELVQRCGWEAAASGL